MCRHVAYLGPPVPLRTVLIDAPYGLYRQAWEPRRQRHGTVNADGFGVGWYAAGDPVPARYRRAVPIWGDPSLPDLARVTGSGAVLAAVRSATPGTALGESAVAPFASGTWLFSHNGVLDGWPAAAEHLSVRLTMPPLALGGTTPLQPPGNPEFALAGTTPLQPPGGFFALEAMVDSAFLWALVAGQLRSGAAADIALAATISSIEAAGGSGRFNFLLTDGRSIAATAAGDTLWYRRADGAVTVASEPCDDEPGWTEVPDRQVLTAAPSRVTVRPLSSLTEGIAIR
jgi:gamma-glutamyl hercynylcysteine S-oxide hydrolase